MSKSRDKSNRAYTKDKKGRRKYVDSASRYAQSSKVHLMQWFQVCIFFSVLTLYTVQCSRNMLTNFMCRWRRCRVNNSGLYMFDISLSRDYMFAGSCSQIINIKFEKTNCIL